MRDDFKTNRPPRSEIGSDERLVTIIWKKKRAGNSFEKKHMSQRSIIKRERFFNSSFRPNSKDNTSPSQAAIVDNQSNITTPPTNT